MHRRRPIVAALVAVLVGLLAPVPASAEVDPSHGWDHRAANVGGDYRAVVGQFAGDLATDILFYAPGAAADSLWVGHEASRGTDTFSKVNLAIGGDYLPIVGDFAGDDYDDILFYGAGSAADSLWVSTDSPALFDKSRKVSVGGAYQPKVLRDYRGEGAKDDILFLGPGAAKDYFWHFTDRLTGDMFGPGTYSSRELKVNGAYQLLVGDYSGDAIDDVVLYQPGSAADYKWVSNAAGAFAQTNLQITGTFQPAVVYGSRYDSILWWASGAGAEAYWTSNGPTFTNRTVPSLSITGTAYTFGIGGAIIVTPSSDGLFIGGASSGDFYELADPALHDQTTATPLRGDFDGDGYLDILWYGPGSQKDELWYVAADAAPAAQAKATAGPNVKATPVAAR